VAAGSKTDWSSEKDGRSGLIDDEKKLQIYRSIDKYDRVGDQGLFDLLTKGRMDKSGAFIPGCGLDICQAASIIAFVNMGKNTRVAKRFAMLERLERTIIDDSGKTALDLLLDTQPKNIGWALDDMIHAMEKKAV
jgi:histidyl-tRNA synthetase